MIWLRNESCLVCTSYSMGNTPSSRYTNALAVASLTPIIFFKNLSCNVDNCFMFLSLMLDQACELNSIHGRNIALYRRRSIGPIDAHHGSCTTLQPVCHQVVIVPLRVEHV